MPFMLGLARDRLASCRAARCVGVCATGSPTRRPGSALVVLWLLPFRVDRGDGAGPQMDFSMWVVGGLLIVRRRDLDRDLQRRRAARRARRRVFGRIRSLRRVLRISVAYPLKTRLRTGMTFAMFTLVVFTLVVGIATTARVRRSVGNVEAEFSGGFDVRRDTSPASPITDMRAAVAPRRRGSEPARLPGRRGAVVRAGEASPGRDGRPSSTIRSGGSTTRTSRRTTLRARRRPAVATRLDRGVWRRGRTRARSRRRRRVHRAAPRNWNFGVITDLQLTASSPRTSRFDAGPVDVRDPQTGRRARSR